MADYSKVQEEDMVNDEMLKRYLEFSLGEETYAVPLLKVREVIARPETTPVPFTPKHFLGIMNLRGQVISVIDLRSKLNINRKKENDEDSAVIIVDLDPIFLGVVVDSVNNVLTLNLSEVNETPKIDSTKNTEYIEGVYRKDEHLILLLNIAQVLDIEDRKAIQSSIKKAA